MNNFYRDYEISCDDSVNWEFCMERCENMHWNELFTLVDGNISSENLSYAWNDLWNCCIFLVESHFGYGSVTLFILILAVIYLVSVNKKWNVSKDWELIKQFMFWIVVEYKIDYTKINFIKAFSF